MTESGDLTIHYQRALNISGYLPTYSVIDQQVYRDKWMWSDTLGSHPWSTGIFDRQVLKKWDLQYHLLDPRLSTFWRNLKPGGINNGAIWEGRGVTASVLSGIFIRYQFLSASFRPQLIYSENRNMGLSLYPVDRQRSQYSYPYSSSIDLPQRFGPDGFWTLDTSGSYMKAEILGIETGISNQNRWWGPAIQYPILMSDNAPGFWHVFLGTSQPVYIGIGMFESTWIWGELKESNYFDTQTYNDNRFLTGLTFTINPKPLPNLTVGASRVLFRTIPPEGIPVNNLFRVFGSFTKESYSTADNPGGNDSYGQMLSIYGRWVFPESGFEIYGEWARDDHTWNWRDALGEPEHSRAYTAGIQKTFQFKNLNILAIYFELVQLESSKTWIKRNTGSYFTHSRAPQGYTHKGQIIGTGLGPGSNGQLLSTSYYHKKGVISIWLRRTVNDNDFFYSSDLISKQPGNSNTPDFWFHNFEIGGGMSVVYFMDEWETHFGFELLREYNEDYIYENDKTILALKAQIRYRL